jgi:hypothetical protein
MDERRKADGLHKVYLHLEVAEVTYAWSVHSILGAMIVLVGRTTLRRGGLRLSMRAHLI